MKQAIESRIQRLNIGKQELLGQAKALRADTTVRNAEFKADILETQASKITKRIQKLEGGRRANA